LPVRYLCFHPLLWPSSVTIYLKKRGCTVEIHDYPRLIAMSEALRSPEGKKSFSDFQIRLKREFPRLERLNIPFVSPDPTR
jgi:hypothetical protein